MRKKPRIRSAKEIAELISIGADRLLKQTKYSPDFLLDEGTEIAEANLVVHLATAFINDGHAVWAEVPLVAEIPKTTDSNSPIQEITTGSEAKEEEEKRGRFDLSIDLDYECSSDTKSLKVEAKRIGESEENEKVEEIVRDFRRMESWRGASPKGSVFPLNVLREFERFYGAIAVVLPQNCGRTGKTLRPSLSVWWKNLRNPPTPPGPERLAELAKILRNAKKRNIVRSKYFENGRRLFVLYAVFDFGKGQPSMEYDNVDLVVIKKRLNVRHESSE